MKVHKKERYYGFAICDEADGLVYGVERGVHGDDAERIADGIVAVINGEAVPARPTVEMVPLHELPYEFVHPELGKAWNAIRHASGWRVIRSQYGWVPLPVDADGKVAVVRSQGGGES